MIDFEEELKTMAEAYGLTEKEVSAWFRGAVRRMWGESVFKRKLEKDTCVMVNNTNPRSMKRFPIVKRFECSGCGVMHSASESELDHTRGENKMTEFSDANSFFKSIFLAKPNEVTWLCSDKKKTKNKKRVTVEIGCHSLKTQMERVPTLSKLEAFARKEVARIKRYGDVPTTLLELGVKVADIPKTKKAQDELLNELIIKAGDTNGLLRGA